MHASQAGTYASVCTQSLPRKEKHRKTTVLLGAGLKIVKATSEPGQCDQQLIYWLAKEQRKGPFPWPGGEFTMTCGAGFHSQVESLLQNVESMPHQTAHMGSWERTPQYMHLCPLIRGELLFIASFVTRLCIEFFARCIQGRQPLTKHQA